MFKAEIKVMLKKGVLDPQGNAVQNLLTGMGHEKVDNVRIGKMITLNLDEDSRDKAKVQVKEMCDKLLSNPVIESYQFELVEVSK